MVDRVTRYQNAMQQIEERNRQSGHIVPVDVPDNTIERHVKNVRPLIVSVFTSQPMTSLCVGTQTRE